MIWLGVLSVLGILGVMFITATPREDEYTSGDWWDGDE